MDSLGSNLSWIYTAVFVLQIMVHHTTQMPCFRQLAEFIGCLPTSWCEFLLMQSSDGQRAPQLVQGLVHAHKFCRSMERYKPPYPQEKQESPEWYVLCDGIKMAYMAKGNLIWGISTSCIIGKTLKVWLNEGKGDGYKKWWLLKLMCREPCQEWFMSRPS